MSRPLTSKIAASFAAVGERDFGWPSGSSLRGLSLAFALTVIGSYLWVFYSLIDVVGGVTRFAVVIFVSLILGSVAARVVPVRVGVIIGGVLFVVGIFAYLVAFPGFERVVFSPGFFVGLSTHLTGISVLRFPKIDLWVLAMAPAPVFLTWYSALRRRYDASAIIGGIVLGFFALTGDAGTSTVLVGMASLLGLLGAGSLEKSESSFAQVEQLGFVLAVGILAARLLPVVPDWGSSVSPSAAAGPASSGGSGRVIAAEDQLDVFGHITLSPEVLFRVTADEAAYWHVAAYDRYTGSGWIRTGDSSPVDGGLAAPPGETKPLRQRYEALSAVKTMPAAWRPTRLNRLAPEARVTTNGTLQPTHWLTPGDTYTVVSQVPTWSSQSLREAGTDYPLEIRERYLQLPESTPDRIENFTERLTANSSNPYETALVINHWLQQNQGYSLNVTRPNGDIAAAFLFEMNEGYCTYFATTMVVMLRSQGIPARLAIGYTSGERADRGEWIVRGLDSHAWAEVYFPEIGWVSFDPTPAGPRQEVERTRFEPGSTENRAFDTAGTDDDPSTPTPSPTPTATTPTPDGTDATNTPAGSPTPETPGAADPDDFAVGGNAAESGGRFGATVTRDRIALLSAAAAVAIGTHRLGILNRGIRAFQLRHQTPTDSPHTDIKRAYERLEHLLAQRDRPRKPAETPRQYLNALKTDVDPRARRVVVLYEQSQYAGAASRDNANEAIELIDTLVSDHGWL